MVCVLTIDAAVSGGCVVMRASRVAHWHRKRVLVVAWAMTTVTWIMLNIVGIARGWWVYNDAYLSGMRLFGLPLEEVVRYVVTPVVAVAVLYILQLSLNSTVSKVIITRLLLMCIGVIIFCLLLSIYKERAAVGCIVTLGTLALLLRTPLIAQRAFWYWNGMMILCCFMVDMLLTATVVQYNNAYATGLSAWGVPLENVLYNFSLCNLFVLVYVLHGTFEHYWRVLTSRAYIKPLATPTSVQASTYHSKSGPSDIDTL